MRDKFGRRLWMAGISALALAAASQASAAVLSGTVSDASGARALQSALVTIVELNRAAETGADGAFRFTDVPPGTYTLRTTYSGGETTTTQVTVAEPGAQAQIVVRPADGSVAELLVVGQRGNLNSSLSRQRQAEGVESVLTRDAVGQFPDQNVAEAVRRAPGGNVLNDQGEGRFIAVRGLDPNLNAASINGARVPAPESDVRSVALDVVPAELVESIEIKKTLTPDMDGDTIGASIEITTTSALDRLKPFLGLTAEGSYNDLTGKWSPKVAADFSRTFGDRLGIAGGLSFYERQFATDNVEADDWDESGGVVSAKTLEYRDYDVNRTRKGASLSVDFRLTDTTDLYARGLYSQFEDQEYRRRLIFEMDEDPSGGSATTAEFDSADGEIKVIRDLKDRFEAQSIVSYTVGGKTLTGPWTFDYSASWSKAREKESGSIDPVEFTRDFDGAGELGVTFDYSDMTKPGYAITQGLGDFLDPSEYEFDKLERTTLSLAEDEEVTVKFDIARSFVLEAGELEIQAGAKSRRREKTYDQQLDVYDGFSSDLTLADFLGPQDYNLATIDPVPGKGGVRGFWTSQQGGFELDAYDTTLESAVSDFGVDEDIDAGYLLARYRSGPVRLVGGVRVERTQNEMRGNLVEEVEEGGTYNGVVQTDDAIFVTPRSFSRDYTDWLPSATLRWDATSDFVVRAGAFRSVVRPGIGQIAPRFVIEQDDAGEREGEFGNPDLDPYKAWNLDLSAEWYFAPEAVLSAGVFHKKIEDFIVNAEFEDGSFLGVAYDEAVIPINGEEATVTGAEFNYQQALRFLPGPFDGLLVGFNYTYTDAEGEVLGRTIPLPASAKHTYNATLGYEKGPVSLRLAAAYRDKYLDELGGDAETDRYVEDHLQYDISAKYRVSSNFQIVAELVNLGDEPYVAYQNGPNGKRLLQYEEYSWTGKIGVRANF